MKQIHILLLTIAAVIGLLVLLSTITDHSAPTLAAPHPDYASNDPLRGFALPLYQAVSCTLNTTSTQDYLGNNHSFAHATDLSDYNNLRLAYGNVPTDPVKITADEDYFQLGATPGYIYQVEAEPDTSNYNLGIVVYDDTYTAIMTDSNTLDGNSASIILEASDAGPYYFKVLQISEYCTGGEYDLNVDQTTPPAGDSYEPNDSINDPADMPVQMPATLGLTFHTADDDDWFRFQAKDGKWYQVTTSDLDSVDTYIQIYDDDGDKVEENDDYGEGLASQVEWEAAYDGDYLIHVSKINDQTVGSYNLTLEETSVATETPEPTNTPVPGPTAIPGADQFEPNHDFDHAATLATDVTYNANFVPWGGGVTEDNDYYKIWIKPGLHFTCFTSDLAPGVDPNMIVYDGNRNGIGGNDDVELGDYNSSFSYFSTYAGWLYILVGHGGRLPASELENSSYKIRCEKEVPGTTSTPTPTKTPQPSATPSPQDTPVPTPTPSDELTVRPLTTPTPVPVGTPASRFIPITLLVYYDANNDHQPGAGEGVAGISAQAYEATTTQMRAQGVTNEQGLVEFTIAAQGPVRVTVPFLGFSQLVAGEGADIHLRIPPHSLTGAVP